MAWYVFDVESRDEQRRHPRFGVRLAVRYTNAQQFVADYVENLSAGGLFIAGAHQLPLKTETDVAIELPGQGSWTVRGRVMFIIDDDSARRASRRPGAGLQIIEKPAGFDDALLGYLLRLGRRRDHSVMAGNVPGVRHVTDAGYRVIALEPPHQAAVTAGDALVQLVAVLVPADQAASYRQALGARGESLVHVVVREDEVHDLLARIDSLL
jgi:Tfp pilus assembly protein PilZ